MVLHLEQIHGHLISFECALCAGGTTLRTTGTKTEEVKPTSTAGETAAKPAEPMQTSSDDCKPFVWLFWVALSFLLPSLLTRCLSLFPPYTPVLFPLGR